MSESQAIEIDIFISSELSGLCNKFDYYKQLEKLKRKAIKNGFPKSEVNSLKFSRLYHQIITNMQERGELQINGIECIPQRIKCDLNDLLTITILHAYLGLEDGLPKIG